MYGTHRPPLVSNRFLELLESLKAEFENLAHEVNVSKIQRDDYERQLQSLLGELTSMQNTLHDLERKHKKLKQQYEEEISRLKSQDPSTVNNNNNNGIENFSEKTSLPSLAFGRTNEQFPINIGKRPIPPSRAQDSKIQKIDDDDKNYSVKTPPPPDSNENGINLLSPKPRELPIASINNNNNNNNNNSNNNNSIVNINNTNNISRRGSFDGSPNEANSTQTSLHNHTLSTSITSISSIQSSPNTVTSPPNENQNIVFTLRRPENTSGGESQDWKFGYNPSVQTDLGVELAYTFDNNSVVCCVRFSNDGEYLATGCNRKAQVFSVSTGEKVHTFTDSSAKDGDLYLRSVCFSPCGKYLACGAEDKTVKLWNIEENESKVYHSFVGHNMDIYSLDFSKDGRFIVSGSGDKKVRIWDVEKKKCFFTLGNDEVGPKDGVTSVAISPDGRLVAAGSLDRIVRLWDVQSGYFLERYEGHTDSVYSVAFSPDGNSLASGSLDKTLKLWDISETRSRSKCRSTFTGHTDFVLSVAFSPDGNWLISGSKDRSVQFWDPRNAVTHLKLEGHKNSVISVAVNPVSGTFATGSGDMKAKIWKYKNVPPSGP